MWGTVEEECLFELMFCHHRGTEERRQENVTPFVLWVHDKMCGSVQYLQIEHNVKMCQDVSF